MTRLAHRALIAAAVLGGSASLPLHALNYPVSSALDSGVGTLRAAITSAELNPGADSITFTLALPATITLASTLPTITQDLLIDGPGTAAQLVISGGDAVRVFRVEGGTVTIQDVTIADGLARGTDGADAVGNLGGGGGGGLGGGAGLYLNGGTLTLQNVVFAGNVARGGDGGDGGGAGPPYGGTGGSGGASSLGPAGGTGAGSSGNGGGGGGAGGGYSTGGNGVAGNAGGGAGQGGSAGVGNVGAAAGGSGGGCGGGSAWFQSAGDFSGVGGQGTGNCTGSGGGGGGGAGLGGAILLRSGTLALSSVNFIANEARRGSAGSGGQFAADGQGKGGALFVDTGATVSATNLIFVGNLADDDLGACNDNDNLYNRGTFPQDPPTDIQLSPASIAENSAVSTVVGSFTTTDPTAGDTHTYTLVPGTGSTDNGQFAISGSQLRTNAVFNHETQPSRFVRVRSTDGCGDWVEEAFTITVTNVNESPTVNAAVFNVAESAAIGAAVGTVTGNDPDAGTALTWSIQSGNTGGAFAINGSTGQITVAAALDHETLASYSLLVRATDNGSPQLYGQNTITVNVTNSNESPDADDDAYATGEDALLTVPAAGVLGNDDDPDGGTPAVVAHDAVSALGAAVTVGADGALSYDPRAVPALQALGTGDSVVDTFTYTIEDAGGLGDTATVSVTVNGSDAALTLTKEPLLPPGPVLLGTTVTFRLTVENLGPGVAVAVAVSDPLPAGLAFLSSACASESGGVVTWTVGDLASGASASCDILATATALGRIENRASGDSLDTPDGEEAVAAVQLQVASEVPALGGVGRLALAAALLALAWLALRRR